MDKKIKPFDLEIQTLGFYVNRVFYMMTKKLNDELKKSGLDIQHAEFTIIKVLGVLGSATQSQIAAALGKERSGISRSLAVLEKKELIRRTLLNGSTNNVELTEKGIDALPLLNRVTDSVTEMAFRGFSQKSRISVINNLNKMYKNALEDE